MFHLIIEFLNILLAALLTGSMFGTWLMLNPAGLTASLFVTLQQQAIRTLNKTMPALGAAVIVITLIAAVLGRADSTRFALLLATLICFIAAGLITRFLNQPINAIVITWNSTAPPANWTDLRDKWWRWHLIRTASGLLGFCLLITATLQRTWLQ